MSAIFLQYQTDFMQSVLHNPVTVEEKSRRTGLSWTASFVADLLGAMSGSEGGMDIFYMGYNLEMAREFIDYCAEHAAVMQPAAAEVHESFWRNPDKPEEDTKIFRIEFESGHKVLALPSRARALRGMQGLVIIDEAAFHDDLAELLKAALALLMWGGKVAIISTHNGDTNPFAELCEDIRAKRKPYNLLRTTFDDALRDGLYKKICERKGEKWSLEKEAAWREEIIQFYGSAADEELFCIPSPSTGSYLPLALIEARQTSESVVLRWDCETAFALLPEHVREAECRRWLDDVVHPVLCRIDPRTPVSFGGDFGRSGDLSVFWFLVTLTTLVRHTPFTVELRNVPFDQQRQILFYILDFLIHFRAGKMDARGNGQYLAEVTMQRYGARVEAVMLSEGWYRENMPPFKAAFEDATLTVPVDRETQDDLRCLVVVRGVARVPEKRQGEKGSKRHGDAAVAACLAYAASRAEPEEYGFEPVTSPQQVEDRRRLDGSSSIEREIELELMGIREGNMGLRGRVL